MGGAIRHLHNFIPALLKNDKTNQYILILRNDVKFDYEDESLQIVRIPKSVGANFFLRSLFDILYLPFFAIKVKADIVISLLNFGPVFCTKPHINFQRNSLYFCNYYLVNITGLEKLFTKLRSALLYYTMKYATIIVTPSDSMAELIKIRYPTLNKNQYHTIYHGFDEDNYETGFADNNFFQKSEGRLKIFYPSHPAFHKGIDLLIELISHFNRLYQDFILIFPFDEKDSKEEIEKYRSFAAKFNIADKIDFIGRIKQERIKFYFDLADVIIFSSMCESFGFPILESLAFGKPIVSVDTNISRELCGDAALYYDPFKPADGAKVLNRMTDPEFRKEYSIKSIERFEARDWSWHHYVKEFIKITESISNR